MLGARDTPSIVELLEWLQRWIPHPHHGVISGNRDHTARTQPVSSQRATNRLPLAKSHTCTELSPPPLTATARPSGNAIADTTYTAPV